ncbi:MAG: type II toxin-antitoxin system VapC family toxin [Deltaproteobacteria bacterium]|nr:type II toxin-antitoxin system VapC family toxin [Deltaproteobacteria bacterium]
MRYLLDTDTCIFLINRKPGYDGVLRRLDGLGYGDVLLSAVTLAELRFGVAKSERGPVNREKLERFLARFEVADFDSDAAAAYGSLRADLEKRGTPIGPLDMLIAAQSLAKDATLVTNNIREFARVAGLRWETWIGPLLP